MLLLPQPECECGGCPLPSARQMPPPLRAYCFPDGLRFQRAFRTFRNLLLSMKPSPCFLTGASMWHGQQWGAVHWASEEPGHRNQWWVIRNSDLWGSHCLPTRWDEGLCFPGYGGNLKGFELGWGMMSASHPTPQLLSSGRWNPSDNLPLFWKFWFLYREWNVAGVTIESQRGLPNESCNAVCGWGSIQLGRCVDYESVT